MAFLEIDETRQGVVTWTVSRPERGNAIGTSLAADLEKAAVDLAGRAAPPFVVVINAIPKEGHAGRIWIAGGDLKELTTLHDADAVRSYAGAMSRLGATLEALPAIVVVAVDGAAIGGGAEVALMGDVRLMTTASAMQFKQLQVGLATGYGTAKRLVDLVGLGTAQGLLFGACTVDAISALKLGLAHQIYDTEAAFKAGVETWTKDLAAIGPEPLAAQKAMFRQACQGHPGTSRGAELQIFTQLWRNPSHARFLAAFASRKDPT